MKTLISLATLLLVAASPGLAQQDTEGEREVKQERRVVISVSHGSDEEGEQFVWVQRDGEEPILHALPLGKARGYLGVNLTEMTPELRQALGAPTELGVLVNRVVPESPAERAGLQAGDVLTRIEGADIASSAAVQAEIFSREKDDVVTLEVYRERKLQQLSATLDEIERPRLNIAEFFPRLSGAEGVEKRLRFVAPNVEVLPLERLEKLERLELRTLPFDEKRLQLLLERAEGPLSADELEKYQELRERIEKQLEEIKKRIEEVEERIEKQ